MEVRVRTYKTEEASEAKKLFEGSQLRCGHNIKIDLNETGYEEVD
jgi:hypothetical protein